MGLKTIAEFKIERLEVLDPEGIADPSVKVDITDDTLLDIYPRTLL